MFVLLLVDRCSPPCRHKIHMTLDLLVAFRIGLHERFDMHPPCWRDAKLLAELTDQGLLRLLAWLDVTTKDIPDIRTKGPHRGSPPQQNGGGLNNDCADTEV